MSGNAEKPRGNPQMNYLKVLERAWHVVWRYRALWVFGVILAVVVAGGAGGSASSGAWYDFGREDFRGEDFRGWEYQLDRIPPEVIRILIAVGITLVCLAILIIAITTIARYVAETALIRLVDDQEKTGEKRSVGQGFRMGWSRSALRLFLINLLITLPTVLVFLLLFALALSPLLLWLTRGVVAGVIGSVAAGSLFPLVILLATLVGAVLSLLKKFFWRACAVENLGVIESIRQGFGVVRQHLEPVAVMWLLMLCVRFGWTIVMAFIGFFLLPVVGLLVFAAMIVAGVVAAVPALLAFGIGDLFFDGWVPGILAVVVGLPIFILAATVLNTIAGAPVLFLRGLMEAFKSSVWTLTYRDLRGLESLDAPVRPAKCC